MRFFADGPLLPDDLLSAQDEGQVVFFCGSGVSRASADLPDFAGLAERVLERLGAGATSEARRLFDFMREDGTYRGVVSADLIFGKLAREFSSRDIDRAVAECLRPQAHSRYSAHRSVLRLARLPDGATRLITTNFDLLFEACEPKLPSSTRSTLPRLAYADNNWGIVHVHGRLTPDYTNCDRDGLVLTSAQFGDAYLAQGWARDFVRDVLDRHIAVFIGYSADDPPMRYLLEGLQQAGRLKHKAYAFLFGSDEEAVAQWREKGVRALPYERAVDSEHGALWRTLDAWGRRSANPSEWRKKIFAMASGGPRKLRPHERGMVAHIVKSQIGARAFQKQTPPLPAEWLCVFDPAVRFGRPDRIGGRWDRGKLVDPLPCYCLDDDPQRPATGDNPYQQPRIPTEAWNAFAISEEDRTAVDDNGLPWLRGHWAVNVARLSPRLDALADWIVRVADQPATTWWAAKQSGGLHAQIIDGVKRHLEDKRQPPACDAVKQAWTAIFDYHEHLPDADDNRYAFADELRVTGWNGYSVRRFADAFAPRLTLGATHRGPLPPSSVEKLTRSHLVSLSVDYPDNISELEIPNDQLAAVLRAFRVNVEQAAEFELQYSFEPDLCAIVPDDRRDDDDFERTYGLSGYVLQFIALYRRLIEFDGEAARAEFQHWLPANPIFSRLRVWASGDPRITGASDCSDVILGLSPEEFWPFKGERDLLLAMRARWAELSVGVRKKIEAQIVRGPPKWPRSSRSDHARRSAHWRLRRLIWLAKNGCELRLDLAAVTARLRQQLPEWEDEWADKAAESHDGRSGTVHTEKDWSALADVPLSRIIDVAESASRKDFLTERDPFRGLCEDAPLKAIGALARRRKAGREVPGRYWSTFLGSERRKSDTSRFSSLVAGRITQIPSNEFRHLLLETARWFEESGPKLSVSHPSLFDGVWAKFIAMIREDAETASSALVRQGDDIDWVMEALNSPVGKLAHSLMSHPAKQNLTPEQGLPPGWRQLADELLTLPGDSRRYALSMFAYNLRYFFWVDRPWAERTFLSIVSDPSTDESDKEAFWAGFMWGASVPQAELYTRLKPHLLSMATEPLPKRRRHGEILSGILLSGWGSRDATGKPFIADDELRTVLLEADDDFRSHLLWNLETLSRHPLTEEVENGQDAQSSEKNDEAETAGDSEEKRKWSVLLPDFLDNVWPKQNRVRTARTSARLCDIALSQGDDFPTIAKMVAKLVLPVEDEQIFIPELRRTKGSLATRFPEAMLELLYAILPENPHRWPYSAPQALQQLELAAPSLLNDPRLIALKGRLGDS